MGSRKTIGTNQKLKNTSKRRRATNKAALIKKAILNIEEKLESNEVKATIGDFIRLLQLEKELEKDRPRDIRVTWVEPAPEELEPVSEK